MVGWFYVIFVVVVFVFMLVDGCQIIGVNVWFKLFKFCVFIMIYCWMVGWFFEYLCYCLCWVCFFLIGVVVSMVVEIVCIGIQVVCGMILYYNVLSVFDIVVFLMMGNFIVINMMFVVVMLWFFF